MTAMTDCTSCKGYGFIAASEKRDGVPMTVVQRCDACNDTIDDDTVTLAVVRLAQAALDWHDSLVYYHDLTLGDFAEGTAEFREGLRLLRPDWKHEQ